MTGTRARTAAVAAAAMSEAATSYMRETAELYGRLAAGWLTLLTHGMTRPSPVAAWSQEAMRLTAEATLRNIEHCHICASRAAGAPK